MAWIELHQEFRDHHKNDWLAAELGVSIAEARSIRICLWLWAAGHARNGDLSKFTEHDIWKGCNANEISKPVTPNTLMRALITAKIVDEKDSKKLLHDWKKHGTRFLDRSRRRVEKYRKEKEHQPKPGRNGTPKPIGGALKICKDCKHKWNPAEQGKYVCPQCYPETAEKKA